MIAAAQQTGKLIVYIADDTVDEAMIKSVKDSMAGAIVLADLLEPLYDASIPTREAAHTLGRVKSELETLIERGARVIVICRRHPEDLGTRSHFLASLCASADRVHFLKRT